MEKLKVYLDTNMIHDLFVQQAAAVKKGVKAEKPSKFRFLLSHKDAFVFVTSFLTKAEIMRELTSAHHLDAATVDDMWSDFIFLTGSTYINQFTFDDTLVGIAGKVRMRLNTLFNFLHLFVAIREGAYFVSGDKQLIEKAKETKLYDKLLTYIDLQKIAPTP